VDEPDSPNTQTPATMFKLLNYHNQCSLDLDATYKQFEIKTYIDVTLASFKSHILLMVKGRGKPTAEMSDTGKRMHVGMSSASISSSCQPSLQNIS